MTSTTTTTPNPHRVLVLGATGYIGQAVVQALSLHGHRVQALLRPGSRAAGLLPAGVEVLRGDLADSSSLSALVTPDVDVVLNLATPSGDLDADAAATEALLEPLRGTGRAFVYTSGVWVLGATHGRVADEASSTDPLDVVAYRPQVEQQVLAAAADGVRSVVVRPGVVHGRGGGIPEMLVSLAAKHGSGLIVGPAPVRWPMVHVDDLADLFVLAAERAEPGSVLHGSPSGLLTLARSRTLRPGRPECRACERGRWSTRDAHWARPSPTRSRATSRSLRTPHGGRWRGSRPA